MDPNSLDLQTRMVNALVDHWPLVAGLAVIARWGFPWALKAHGPPMVKETMTNFFNNGGGDKVRDIVRAENAIQSAIHKDEIRSAIKDHETVEEQRFKDRIATFRDEFRDEITGEFDLRIEPTRPAPRRRRSTRRR